MPDDLMTANELPAPETLVKYDDGTVAAVMLHYAPADIDGRVIAAEHGFECSGVTMEGDLGEGHPLVKAYFDEDDHERWPREWSPSVPDGWSLAATFDSEDGPCAMFIRQLKGEAPDV